jgi:uncharacterized protein (DUF2147 family)
MALWLIHADMLEAQVSGMKLFSIAGMTPRSSAAKTAIAATLAALAALVWAGPASAAEADPTGDWVTEGGAAVIRIEPCDDALCGAIAWVKNPGTDRNNPDPAKRNVDVVGLPILLGMRLVSKNRWEGQVYNAENGKIYLAYISLVEPDVLRIRGCILGGLLCGGEKWTRLSEPLPPMPPAIKVE